MRRVILSTLVLFPVLANAQASTSTESKQYPTSAGVLAELERPAGLADAAMAAAALEEVKPAAKAPASVASATSEAMGHAAVREFVQTRQVDNFTDAALRQGGTLEFSMKATPVETSEPQVTRAVEVDLTPDELAEAPAVTKVVVRAIVDQYGFPRNVMIAQSAGPEVDRKAIAAVSQYRFKPATVDNQPTWASVSIAIKIQKQ
jgi:TonB family protein